MKIRSTFTVAALLIATAAITSQVVSQDAKKQQPPMTPEQKAMMDKWQAFATPGENHKLLNAKAGKWDLAVKMWEQPGQTPTESKATSEFQWIFDGRYLVEHAEGNFMDMPFEGRGLTGYDNLKKKYVSLWIDNMGTGIMTAEGTYDAASKTFKYAGEMPDVNAGKYVKTRSVEKVVDNDHWTVEMYGPDASGKEFKSMEITYTRAK